MSERGVQRLPVRSIPSELELAESKKDLQQNSRPHAACMAEFADRFGRQFGVTSLKLQHKQKIDWLKGHTARAGSLPSINKPTP